MKVHQSTGSRRGPLGSKVVVDNLRAIRPLRCLAVRPHRSEARVRPWPGGAILLPRRRKTMTVLRGATLIDGTGAPPVRDATIVVQDGRIESIATGPGDAWPSHEVIDATGLTVLPGLIDCHDHLAMHGYELASRWGLSEPASTRSLRTARVIE